MKPTNGSKREIHAGMAVGILGMGRLGSALAQGLETIGCRVSPRSRGKRQQVLEEWLKPLEVICLSVRDDQIGRVVEGLADRSLAGKMVLIHAGAVPLQKLLPLRDAGASIGKFHPLMTFSDKTEGGIPKGTPFAFEGDGVADVVAPWVKAWQGQLFEVRGDQWHIYHLSAVLAANFLPLFIRTGAGLLEELTDGDRADALAWLAPLVRHSVEKALDPKENLPFSGPAIRGDREVLAVQEAILAKRNKPWADLYRLASDRIAGFEDDVAKGAKKNLDFP